MGVQVNSYFKSKYTGAQIENMLDAFGNTASAYETSTAYSVGDLVLYNNALYVCTGATTGAFDPTKWQQTTLAELVENLGATYSDPQNDGNVVVGVDSTTGTKTIKSISFPTLTNKYIFPFAQYIRTDASNDPSAASFGIEIPDAEEAPMHSTVIKGKTVAVNQRLHVSSTASTTAVGVTVTNNNDGSYTFNGTATGNGNFLLESSYPKSSDHSYLFIGYKQVGSNTGYLGYGGVSVDTGNGGIKTGGTGTWNIRIDIRTGDVFNNDKMYPMVIDLTARGFTSAETTDVATLKTAWLKKYGTPLPLYIPYDAGSLANVNGVYRMRGRNLWDEEWEVGSIDNNTGQDVYATTTWRCKNYISVEPSKAYYFYYNHGGASLRFYWYDAEKNFISSNTVANNALTAPSNAKYLRIRDTTQGGATYTYDVTINGSDPSINGQYIPSYNGGTIDCSSAPLNGVGTAQDEKDFATGTRVTRCGIVDLGTLTWEKSGEYFRTSGINSTIKRPVNNNTIPTVVCGRYISAAWNNPPDKSVTVEPSNESAYAQYLWIHDTSYSDAATFQSAMSGVMLGYEAATPTTSNETPQPLETQYGYNCFEPVSGGVQSAEVDAVYYENIAGYIDKKLAEG